LSRLDKFSAAGGPQADLFAPIGVAADTTTERGATGESTFDALAAQLAALDPDAMTPRDALAALYELRKLLRS
jgi:DNA mismatch repair protein MutS